MTSAILINEIMWTNTSTRGQHATAPLAVATLHKRRSSAKAQLPMSALGGMALGGSVALAAVGPLVIDRAMPAVVVGGDKIVFQRRST